MVPKVSFRAVAVLPTAVSRVRMRVRPARPSQLGCARVVRVRARTAPSPEAPSAIGARRLVARLGGRALFTFVIARVLRRFPAYTSRHMARLAGRVTVDDVTTLRTTAYRYTSRAQSATREPM